MSYDYNQPPSTSSLDRFRRSVIDVSSSPSQGQDNRSLLQAAKSQSSKLSSVDEEELKRIIFEGRGDGDDGDEEEEEEDVNEGFFGSKRKAVSKNTNANDGDVVERRRKTKFFDRMMSYSVFDE
jgi:hypothetical protein